MSTPEATLEMQAAEMVTVDLEPRVELGVDSGAPLAGRISFAEPTLFVVSASLITEGSAALNEYLNAESAHSTYYFLGLLVSVWPEDGEVFRDLVLQKPFAA